MCTLWYSVIRGYTVCSRYSHTSDSGSSEVNGKPHQTLLQSVGGDVLGCIKLCLNITYILMKICLKDCYQKNKSKIKTDVSVL